MKKNRVLLRLLGAALFALLVVAAGPLHRVCSNPECGELIKRSCRRCPHCQTWQ